jgi:hypothetical protein
VPRRDAAGVQERDRAGIRRGLQCEDGRDGHCGRLRGVRGERL